MTAPVRWNATKRIPFTDIKTNGACLNEQVKKITRHFVLRKEKIVHEKS